MDQKINIVMIEALPNNDATNNKFFEDESTIIDELSNNARSFICLHLENNTKLKENSSILFDEAKNKISSDIANKVPEMIQNNKAMLTSFINKKSRKTPTHAHMLTLIIQALNLDNKWLGLLHHSLKTATSDS
jgi:hypothetical protein